MGLLTLVVCFDRFLQTVSDPPHSLSVSVVWCLWPSCYSLVRYPAASITWILLFIAILRRIVFVWYFSCFVISLLFSFLHSLSTLLQLNQIQAAKKQILLVSFIYHDYLPLVLGRFVWSFS